MAVPHGTKREVKRILGSISLYEKEIGKTVDNWSKSDVCIWTKEKEETISETDFINKLIVINECRKKNNDAVPVWSPSDFLFSEWCNIDILKKTTYTKIGFYNILSYLRKQIEKIGGSYRDLVVLELWWAGLTKEEVSNLKKENVIITNLNGKKSVICTLDNITYTIEDTEWILDFENYMKEKIYKKPRVDYRNYDIVMYNFDYIKTDYFIRKTISGNNGPTSKDERVVKLYKSIESAIDVYNVQRAFPQYDMVKFSYINIRRSAIVNCIHESPIPILRGKWNEENNWIAEKFKITYKYKLTTYYKDVCDIIYGETI